MKKKALLFSFVMLTASSVFGQVGVNTDTPSATLDVTASTTTTTADGIIAPRVTLANLQTKDDSYTSSQTGALVYVTDNTGTPTGKTAQITSVGYYYFDGSAWQSIGGKVSVPTEPWQVQGGTTQATGNSENIYQTGKVAIGTDTSGDNQFYVNGLTALNGATTITGATSITGNTTITGDANVTGNSTLGSGVYVTSDGNIGVGTTTPTAQIHIVGDSGTKSVFTLEDAAVESEGYTGKILTADASGNGKWMTPGTSYAIMGGSVANITASTNTFVGSWQTSVTSSERRTYGGMYIDLPKGIYQVNFTLWVTAYAGGTGSSRFGAAFFSKSSTTQENPTYATKISSVLMNPAYSSGENDFYVSGAIPVKITDSDVSAADDNAIAGGSIVSPKAADRCRLYLWVYLSANVGNVTVYSRTQSPGSFGPYTQIYALPFALQE